MIAVELKPLLSRLNKLCTRAVENAAGLCVARGHYEVTPEHLIQKLLDSSDSDFAFILFHFGVDAPRLTHSLEKALEGMRHGNAGKPVLSPGFVEWLEDAWLMASIDQGLSTIRSGSLALALAARSRRYLTSDHPELDKIQPDDLKRNFRSIVAGSAEDALSGADALPTASVGEDVGVKSDSALARFAVNLTAAARSGKLDPVLARDREIRQAIDILLRRRKNNPIIVGDAGVGKTAIVEGLALRIAAGEVPTPLKDVDIYALDIGLLQAGAGVRGEFESRLKAVIHDVRSASGTLILFIDEAHTLIGAGNAPGASDAANLLKPALARGDLRTIAATTWSEYKRYFEEDAALTRRFQPIRVDEPSATDAAIMLRGLKDRYEKAHEVIIRDDAIEAAAQLSARYITGRLLPDKAVDLLDTTAARIRVGQSTKPGRIEDAEHGIEALEKALAGLARDREGGAAVDEQRFTSLTTQLNAIREDVTKLTAKWTAELEAVQQVMRLRRKAAADPSAREELETTLVSLKQLQGSDPLVRLEVDPEVVAQVVADWTGVPVGKMIEDEATKMLQIEPRLKERIKGQDHAVEIVSKALRAAKVGLKDPSKPQVFLLVGPSGVGKTEMGLTVADTLFGGERFVVSINMSEYQDREMGVSGLLGAKPGYVGYGKGGTLTEAVRQRPYSVVLLDEIDKACQEVRNLFYQVFDKGELTDGTGRKVDFKNTVIFMTTNLTADTVAAMTAQERPSVAVVLDAIRPTLSRALGPAWLARTTVVPLYALRREAIGEIAKLKVKKLAARLMESHRIVLEASDAVLHRIVARCTEAETGARNIDFVLEGSIMPLLSSGVLQLLSEGVRVSRMALDVDGLGEFVLTFPEACGWIRTPPAK